MEKTKVVLESLALKFGQKGFEHNYEISMFVYSLMIALSLSLFNWKFSIVNWL